MLLKERKKKEREEAYVGRSVVLCTCLKRPPQRVWTASNDASGSVRDDKMDGWATIDESETTSLRTRGRLLLLAFNQPHCSCTYIKTCV